MSMEQEQQPTSTYDIITAHATRLLIANPERVKEYIEKPGVSLALLNMSGDNMPDPANYGYIHYNSDPVTNKFRLSGRVNFTPPANNKEGEAWQDELLQYINATLRDNEATVLRSPSHRSTLYTQLDETHVVKITIDEDTDSCGLVLEVDELLKLQRALGLPSKGLTVSDTKSR